MTIILRVCNLEYYADIKQGPHVQVQLLKLLKSNLPFLSKYVDVSNMTKQKSNPGLNGLLLSLEIKSKRGFV